MKIKEKQILLVVLIAIIIGLNFSGSFFNLVNLNIKFSINYGIQSPKLSNDSSVDRWDRTWGQPYYDEGEDVAKDSLDNLYIVGRVSFTESNPDFCVVKYNSSGDFEWYSAWGGPQADYGKGVAIDSIGNIYITGFTWSYGPGEADPCLVKFNSLGEFEWYRTWGGTSWDSGNDLVIDASDNIYVTGIYDSGSGDTLFLIKYNSSGDQEWNRTESWGRSGRAITIDSSSEYIYVTGHGSSGAFLSKHNTSGDLEWYRTWEDDYWSGCGIAIDSTNNIYIIERGGNLMKYNNLGVELWSTTPLDVGGVTLDDIILDSSENIYLVGDKYNYWTSTDMYLCKFNNSGDFEWDLSWGGSGYEYCNAIVLDSEDNVYLAGTKSTSSWDNSDLCLVKNPLNTARPPPPPLPPPGTIESQVFQLFLYLFLVGNVVSITGITIYYNKKERRH